MTTARGAMPTPSLSSEELDRCVFALTSPAELHEVDAAASAAGQAIADRLDDVQVLLDFEENLRNHAAMRADAALQAGYLLGLAAGRVADGDEAAIALAEKIVATVTTSRLPIVRAVAAARVALDALLTPGDPGTDPTG